MAVENPGFVLSLTATASLATAQYHAVNLDAANDFSCVLAGAGDEAVGIMQDAPAAGQRGNVMTNGMSKAVIGNTIVRGDKLTPDANGHLVKISAPGDAFVALALESGVANDIRSVLLVK